MTLKIDIHTLILKLLCDPDSFTVAQLKDLERMLNLYHGAKSMRLDTDLIDDQQVEMIINE